VTAIQTEAFMKGKNIFEDFDCGKLFFKGNVEDISKLAWNKHAKFEGVELKHIITAKHTDGKFSCHLVKVAPGKKIGEHLHNGQIEIHEVVAGYGKCICAGEELEYVPGNIGFMPADVLHEVIAGPEGVYLLAKFFPALC